MAPLIELSHAEIAVLVATFLMINTLVKALRQPQIYLAPRPISAKVYEACRRGSSGAGPWGPISSQGLEKIATHKYKSGGWTHLDIALDYWWRFTAPYLPSWLAPNVVTLSGLACLLVAFAVNGYYDSDLASQARPRWLGYVTAAALFGYQTFDALDGKHARATGAASPLGQLFDHGVDAFAAAFTTYISVATLACSEVQFLLMLAAVILPFFAAQWRERHTHVLSTNVGPIGVSEGQVLAIIIALASTAFPASTFHAPILPASSLKVIETLAAGLPSTEWASCVVGVFAKLSIAGTIVTLVCATNSFALLVQVGSVVVHYSGNVRAQAAALFELVPMAALTGLSFAWQQQASYRLYPLATVSVIAFAFTRITAEMIVSAMTGDPYTALQPVLVPVAAIVAHGWLVAKGTAAAAAAASGPAVTAAAKTCAGGCLSSFLTLSRPVLSDDALVVLAFVITGGVMMRWVQRACRQIANRLGIYVLTIGKKPVD